MILAFNHYISDVFVFGAFNSTIIGRQGFPQFEKQMSGSLRLLATCVASRGDFCPHVQPRVHCHIT